jgi:glycine oxidase
MFDCLVVGAGVVGLSIAYELAGHGFRVQVIERGQCGREASWAGAGILPAAVLRDGDPAYDQLSGLSRQLHAKWAEDLQAETGIDTGYHICSEIFFNHHQIDGDPLSRDFHVLKSRGIKVDPLDGKTLRAMEPALSETVCKQPDLQAYHTPDSAQIRNPWHLKALVQACLLRGVKIVEQTEVLDFDFRAGKIVDIKTTAGNFSAEHFCLASGAWTTRLAESLGVAMSIKPIRGQIVLLRLGEQILRNVIHEGGHYLVPRCDGRVLAGSTLEDVGFEKRTTAEAVTEILQFAKAKVPRLATAEVEQCWAGFRPASLDGRPSIGRLPGLSNGWVAAGHFRWGLYLSCGTATLLGQLMRDVVPQVDLTDFRVERQTASAL